MCSRRPRTGCTRNQPSVEKGSSGMNTRTRTCHRVCQLSTSLPTYSIRCCGGRTVCMIARFPQSSPDSLLHRVQRRSTERPRHNSAWRLEPNRQSVILELVPRHRPPSQNGQVVIMKGTLLAPSFPHAERSDVRVSASEVSSDRVIRTRHGGTTVPAILPGQKECEFACYTVTIKHATFPKDDKTRFALR